MAKNPDLASVDPPVVLEERPADNGPAVLRGLLLGFGIDVSLSELRRRLDPVPEGTSIDDLEELANQLGLHAEQVMMPAEHVTLASPGRGGLPAVAVVEDDFEGSLFLLIWRTDGDRVQVMHTTGGAFWLSREELELWLYRHEMSCHKPPWVDYSVMDDFLGRVGQRVLDFGATPRQAAALAKRAGSVPGHGPAALDAAIRWQRTGGPADLAALEATFEGLLAEPRSRNAASALLEQVPKEHWFAMPDGSSSDEVILRGAVVMTARQPRRRRWLRWFS